MEKQNSKRSSDPNTTQLNKQNFASKSSQNDPFLYQNKKRTL